MLLLEQCLQQMNSNIIIRTDLGFDPNTSIILYNELPGLRKLDHPLPS